MKFKIVVILTILLTALLSLTSAASIESGVEVALGSELTYYLEIFYDGKDVYGVQSSDSIEASIVSDYIYVEDKLPEGLTFKEFLAAEDDSIGAVNRTTGAPCVGYVVDDVAGLKYDSVTNTVSFAIKNLKAGCSLTVGIKTLVPDTVDDPNTEFIEYRRDFFNSATANEWSQTVTSNMVHAWIGKDNATLYNVTYQYTGEIPTNASALPFSTSYTEGTTVGVASNAYAKGYTFSGWSVSSGGASISDGKFVMPANNVVLTGSFTKIPEYTVTYKLADDSEIPKDYVLPTTKTYYQGDTVQLDKLKAGDLLDNYRFLGWTTEDAVVDYENSEFTMPNKNVVLVGKWEQAKYSVSYQFMGEIFPPNANSLLPETKTYLPGETVALEEIAEPAGYVFLGWYKEDNFIMPEEDVIIYGEWKQQNGTFSPTITKAVVSIKDYYTIGDTVEYRVVVTNTADFAIKDVYLAEDNYNSNFLDGDGYEVASSRVVKILEIPANSSIVLRAEYLVTSKDSIKVENRVSIVGASADNYYELDPDGNYSAGAEFNVQPRVNICKDVSLVKKGTVFQFKVLGVDNDYETWVLLEANSCKEIYLDPGTYSVEEVLPQEYVLDSVTGAITKNGQNLIVEHGYNYSIQFTNKLNVMPFYHSFGRIVNIVQ